jgi:Phage integrase, N-terminal SAM-like domain
MVIITLDVYFGLHALFNDMSWEMVEPEINAFLTHLAVKEKVRASTQNQALSALLFLYRHVIWREVGDLGEVFRTI